MPSITFGILTVSDTCYHDNTKDASGTEAKYLVENAEASRGGIFKGLVSCKKIVSDDEQSIMETLINWSDEHKVNVILTIGGTGFAPRDVTPEATKKVIDREAPGIISAILLDSLKVTPMAMLSRAICGIRNKTLIINLPGSPKAVKESFNIIAIAIPHAVALIIDDRSKIQKDHHRIQTDVTSNNIVDPASEEYQKLMTFFNDIPNRPRQSPYPMISLEEAKEILFNEISCRHIDEVNKIRCKYVQLEKSHDKILATSITSQCDLPPFRASIKDGYAVIVEDGAGARSVIDSIEAGHKPSSVRLCTGQCVRVNTGAPIPDGATAVVQVEDTRLLASNRTQTEKAVETMIEILIAPKTNQDIRNVGSDIKKGALILRERARIGSAEMGILAACGLQDIPIIEPPVVGILSTGNELQAPGGKLEPGHVYDSNKITLMAILKENGYDSIDLGIVNDDLEAMIIRIKKALASVDVLVTTGSVSMGDRDMLKPIFKEFFGATIHFGRVNLKPGKPTTFATCTYHGKKKYLLCLPGNPVSAMVTAHLFAIPLLHRMSFNDSTPTIVTCKLMTDYTLDPRPEYARAILKWESDGIPNAYLTGNQISSRLLSCNKANAFLMLPAKTEEKSVMKVGDLVPAMLIGFDKTFSQSE